MLSQRGCEMLFTESLGYRHNVSRGKSRMPLMALPPSAQSTDGAHGLPLETSAHHSSLPSGTKWEAYLSRIVVHLAVSSQR